MGSWQARVADRAIRVIVRRRHWGDEQALARRARRVFGAPPPYARLAVVGVRCDRVSLDRVRGEWVVPRSPQPGVVLYLHGGGFVSCSAATHRPITAALARFTQRRVFAVDYRLAPESRLPAAHDDVFTAYQWLCDSTDLAGRGASLGANEGRCAMFYPENIRDFAVAALGAGRADLPEASPVLADLRDLPPVLLHVGSTELLLDDARRVHERIQANGGACEHKIYADVPHGWQMLAPWIPEATDSLREAARFIDRARH